MQKVASRHIEKIDLTSRILEALRTRRKLSLSVGSMGRGVHCALGRELSRVAKGDSEDGSH